MKEADIIKLATLAYWRYDRQHIVGAIECGGADVMTMSKSLLIAESEVKVTIADMRREFKTKSHKHQFMLRGGFNRRASVNYFYFVVPERLKEKALEVVKELYPYAGLLVSRKHINIYYGEPNIYSLKSAKRMQRPKPLIDEIIRMGYAASNTAIRYGNKLIETNEVGSDIELK